MANADHIANIWTFKTRNFMVTVDAYYDYDVDLSWDETGEVRDNLESGKWVAFYTVARCVHFPSGVEGSASLGGSIYADPQEFRDHMACGRENRRLAAEGYSARCGSYFADMVRECVAECRKTLAAAKSVQLRAA